MIKVICKYLIYTVKTELKCFKHYNDSTHKLDQEKLDWKRKRKKNKVICDKLYALHKKYFEARYFNTELTCTKNKTSYHFNKTWDWCKHKKQYTMFRNMMVFAAVDNPDQIDKEFSKRFMRMLGIGRYL